MRLLHTRTYQLETFLGTVIPPYAILSHTWGQDEFVFEDLKAPFANQLENPKRGLRKVLQACALAVKDGFDYVWIDTCCIDKSSSAELSEAINSMFAWYRKSSNCYVWLEDVTLSEGAVGQCDGFEDSNWFCRGWTLQELIAPHDVAFYDSNWNLIDDRYALASRISSLTSIKQEILQRRHKRREDDDELPRVFSDNVGCPSCGGDDNLGSYLWKIPTATRMAWAAGRQTSRAEDEAYCLLGLFDVNMPLLYGEGRDKAFRRLLLEMLQHNQADSSILLWQMSGIDNPWLCLPMGLSPRHFEWGFSSLHLNPMWPKPDLVVTPRGLEVSVWLAPSSAFRESGVPLWDVLEGDCQLAILSPSTGCDRSTALGIFVTPLYSLSTDEILYTRAEPSTIIELHEAPDGNAAATIRRSPRPPSLSVTSGSYNSERSQDDVYIKQSEFVMTRIMLSISQAVRSPITKAAAMRVDARNCSPYSIHTMTPTAENFADQRSSVLFFDDFENGPNAANAAILAFTTADLSSGFFVFWRDGANQQGGTITVTPWSYTKSEHSTPAETFRGVWWFKSWLENKQWSLRHGLLTFSEFPALLGVEESGGTYAYSCLPELNVRATVVRQSFLGNNTFKLLVEVGPAVPETAELWAARGVEVPGVKEEAGSREECEPDDVVQPDTGMFNGV